MQDENSDRSAQKAVALSYKPEKDVAPKIVAKGRGKLAERIIEIAQHNGVEIRREAELVETLYNVEVNKEIPIDLYEAVAAILAYVFQKHKRM